MKITLYTITDCPFCQEAKDYFTALSLAFDEKNIQLDRSQYATMQGLAGDFSGVPFTVVEKEDGSTDILKGFTKEEYDKVFVTNTAHAQNTTEGSQTPDVDDKPQTPPTNPQPTTGNLPSSDSSDFAQDKPTTTNPQPTTNTVPPISDSDKQKLDGILNDLSTKAVPVAGSVPTPPQPVQTDLPDNTKTPSSNPQPTANSQQPIINNPQPATINPQPTSPTPPPLPDFPGK